MPKRQHQPRDATESSPGAADSGKTIDDIDAVDDLDSLELVGGRACLDFVNTVDPRVGSARRDYLAAYADLVRWSAHAGLLPASQAAALLRAAARQPRAAGAVFVRAIALRELLYRVFAAVAQREQPVREDLDALRAAYVDTLAQARLMASDGGFAWQWSVQSPALDAMLWPVIRSAVELLTAPELGRVRMCPGSGDCGWLFLDTSKSGRRRWCSMDSCGSRVKMRRYYARTRTAMPTSAPAGTD